LSLLARWPGCASLVDELPRECSIDSHTQEYPAYDLICRSAAIPAMWIELSHGCCSPRFDRSATEAFPTSFYVDALLGNGLPADSRIT